VLVSLTNAYNFSGLIKFKEKIQFITQIKASIMLSIYLIFHQKIRLGILINVMLIKKHVFWMNRRLFKELPLSKVSS